MPSQEKRLSKLQILVTDSELQNIDDWRFDNRAENRSSAVRELIALGLTLTAERPDEAQQKLKALRSSS
ncbi:hypothetical protein [Parvularcula lutaonensis]|uniref:CopG family transcriptional regulator n=1 Tax=Parvularcula lutaonensis TaxID=491923 RepID=A0ABV7MDN6_9PROT|nr:hypothetical protein [Parvularcula lutaonensis]GGY51848.1 hypothetical protein GCM10007148_20970 [Parvularcula lutaonensis]